MTDRHRQAAKLLIQDGKGPRDALRLAGYTEATAKHGMTLFKTVPSLRLALAQEIAALTPKSLPTAPERANYVRWKLLQNISEGKDKAVVSLKLAGQDKDVNMWANESQVGVIVIQPSQRSEGMLAAFPAPEFPAASQSETE